MKKNVASQAIGAQMVSATDGSAFTGSVTVYVTGDAGTQAVGSVGSGACTHEGNGYHTYAPAQAETNYDLVAFTFIGTGAIPATVQCYTNFPQTVDNATNISAIKTTTDKFVFTVAGYVDANTLKVGGTTQTARDIGASVLLSAGIGTGQLDFTSGVVKANATQILGTAVSTPATAGILDVNVKNMNNVAGTAITTIKAVQGLTTADTVTTVSGNVNGSVGSVTGAVGSVTGNVGGNVVGSVGSLTTNNDKTGYSLTAGQLFVKKNTALSNFMFVMTDSTTHAPKTAVTVTAQRSIDGAAFAACANAVTELSNGVYTINLANTDLNGTNIMLRFTGASSDDLLIEIITQA